MAFDEEDVEVEMRAIEPSRGASACATYSLYLCVFVFARTQACSFAAGLSGSVSHQGLGCLFFFRVEGRGGAR